MSDLAIDTTCTDDGGLTIDGLTMRCAAWWVPSLVPLWLYGAVRGDDLVIPGVNGAEPRLRLAAPTEHQLAMLIVGAVNRLGVLQADPWEGFQANVTELRTVLDPDQSTYDAARTAVLTMPNGTTRSATVHTGLDINPEPAAADSRQVVFRAVLNLTVLGPFA